MPEEKVARCADPDGPGRYVCFASQESSCVTGEVLGLTGGQPLT